MEKRKYQKRIDEFYDLSVDQIKDIITDLKSKIKSCDDKIITLREENADISVITGVVAERKDYNNKRVRAYARLCKLGYSSKEVRAAKAQAKKNIVVTPVVSSTSEVILPPVQNS